MNLAGGGDASGSKCASVLKLKVTVSEKTRASSRVEIHEVAQITEWSRHLSFVEEEEQISENGHEQRSQQSCILAANLSVSARKYESMWSRSGFLEGATFSTAAKPQGVRACVFRFETCHGSAGTGKPSRAAAPSCGPRRDIAPFPWPGTNKTKTRQLLVLKDTGPNPFPLSLCSGCKLRARTCSDA